MKRYHRGSVLEYIGQGHADFSSIRKQLNIRDSSLHDVLKDLQSLGYIQPEPPNKFRLTKNGKAAQKVRRVLAAKGGRPLSRAWDLADSNFLDRLVKHEIIEKCRIVTYEWTLIAPKSTYTCPACRNKTPLYYPLPNKLTCKCGHIETFYRPEREPHDEVQCLYCQEYTIPEILGIHLVTAHKNKMNIRPWRGKD